MLCQGVRQNPGGQICSTHCWRVSACKQESIHASGIHTGIMSLRRWCCSGTPISTEIKDFTGQFTFLGVSPFGDRSYFNNFVRP